MLDLKVVMVAMFGITFSMSSLRWYMKHKLGLDV